MQQDRTLAKCGRELHSRKRRARAATATSGIDIFTPSVILNCRVVRIITSCSITGRAYRRFKMPRQLLSRK